MEIPDVVLDALVNRRIPHSDVGILLTIATLQRDGRFVGSLPELAEAVGVSKDTLQRAMQRLQAAGFVSWNPSKTRYVQSVCDIIVPIISPMIHQANNQSDDATGPLTSDDCFDEGLLSTDDAAVPESSDVFIGTIEDKGVPKGERTKKTYAHDSDPYRLADRLLRQIRRTLDGNRIADLNSWAVHMERIIRIDKRDVHQVEDVLYWLEHGSDRHAQFWRTNILSARKLRDQFPTLVAQMGKNGQRPQVKVSGPACPECDGLGHLIRDGYAHKCTKCKGQGVLA